MTTRTLLTLLSGAALTASAPLSVSRRSSTDSQCSSYTVESASSDAYFENHKFYDFRSLSTVPATPAKVTTDGDQEDDTYQAQLDSALASTGFTSDWTISTSTRDGDGYAYAVENSVKNVYVVDSDDGASDYNTYLGLRTYRLDDFQSSAEILTQDSMTHMSVRMRARISGDPGAVAAMFTYADDTNESDIEMRTEDSTDEYHYTNQPGASQNVSSLPTWDQWHTHRLDWLDDNVAWYIDNQLVAQSSKDLPELPSTARLNIWSSGGAFSGIMNIGGEATMDVQWIEIVYNTTDNDSSSSKAKRDPSLLSNFMAEANQARNNQQNNNSNQGKAANNKQTTTSSTPTPTSTAKGNTKQTTTTTTSKATPTTTSKTSTTTSKASSTTSSTLSTLTTSAKGNKNATTSSAVATSSAATSSAASSSAAATSAAATTQAATGGSCSIDGIAGLPNVGQTNN